MARKPVTIPIATDTRDFTRGIKDGVVEPVEDMVDALKDADRQADKTGDGLEDAMREAQRATENLEEAQDDLYKTLDRGSKDGFKKVASHADQGLDRAGEASKEFKEEATANFSEVASSFSGDMDSAIDLVQGTLGGLAGSIPGVGLALAGLGAAAGLFYNQWKEKTEAAKQRVQDMYDDMLESGQNFLSKDYIQEQINLIVTSSDGAALKMKDLKRIAEGTGQSQADLLLAFAGDLDTRTRLIGDLTDQVVDYEGAVKRAHDGTMTAQDQLTIASVEAIRKLKAQNEETGKAAGAINAQREAVSKLNATQGRTYDDMVRNQGEVYDSLGTINDAIDQLPNKKAVDIKVNADTSKVQSQINNAFKNRTFKIGLDVKPRPGVQVR